MGNAAVDAIEASVTDLLRRRSHIVLAISGGLDSSVLLDAVGRLRGPEARVTVATVDHGTGPAATEAAAHAVATAARFGFPAITERFTGLPANEAQWRNARWDFLRNVARHDGAVVVTAHTRDDQLETVIMRILRGASARGLAGLRAEGVVERPLLDHPRAAVEAYARARRVEWVDDPSNASLTHFRNRVRHDLLPAIARLNPDFAGEILALSGRAAALRSRVESVAAEFLAPGQGGALVTLDAGKLARLTDDGMRLVLPALLARGGVILDRRGLDRLVDLVGAGQGARGQLSGGVEAVRTRRDLVIRRLAPIAQAPRRLAPTGDTEYAGFLFHAQPAATFEDGKGMADSWRFYFPRSSQLFVRQWHPGDRLTTGVSSGRKVKRYFSDAGIAGPLRHGWPVVVAGNDVIWIPGIRSANTHFSVGEAMIEYRCERLRG